jgi:3-hydroxyisobutyrate dehydrogenase-like beta-hydroxyacid dehydrogenase
MRLAVLGMGSMGRAFAARALEKGHQVTVWNRTPDRAADLASGGAVEAPTPKEAVAGSEVVLVVLADDDAVLSVCLGEHGVLESLPSGAVLAIVSTVSPDTVCRLAAVGPEGAVLDSPVMGSPSVIGAGLGSFLIGGAAPTVTGLEALWSDLGAGYRYCGPVGSGATMKLVSNLLLITGVAAVAEAIATARHHGIPDDLLQSTLADSFVVSPATKMRLQSLFDAAHPGWFTPELARKDVRLAVGLAEQADVGVLLGPATDTLLTAVIDAGRPWPDFSAVIEALSPPGNSGP